MLLINKYIPPCYKIRPGKFIQFRTPNMDTPEKRKVHSIVDDTEGVTKCKYGCLVVLQVIRGTKFWVSPSDVIDSGCLHCIFKQ